MACSIVLQLIGAAYVILLGTLAIGFAFYWYVIRPSLKK